jgi:two-component system chemotaxis response regulator CheY
MSQALSLAGFQVTLIGRFWVTAEVVLVDWNMPVMSGIDFIRAVRELHIYDPLPLIMVTTNSESDYVGTAMEAGANEYIQKPCTLDALREKLDLLGLLKT